MLHGSCFDVNECVSDHPKWTRHFFGILFTSSVFPSLFLFFSERISARPFSLEANSPLGASNHHTTRSDIHHSFRIAEPSKNRHHRRGVVVGHTAAPSENASNVHIRGSRNRLGKGRGTTLTTLMNQHSSEEKAVGSFPPIKASSVRLLVVRSFGGDDGSVVSIYHCGTIAGTPKPIVAVGGSATTASGLSVLPKLGSDYKSENTIPFNSYPESMDGEFCPNILKDTVAKMWADHVSCLAVTFLPIDCILWDFYSERVPRTSLYLQLIQLL